jgi:hypothetical protein
MYHQIVDFHCQLTLIFISDRPDVAFGFRCIAKRLVSSSVDHLPTKGRVRYAWKSTLTLLCEIVRSQVSGEADVSSGRISWISLLATALIKAREGDRVTVKTPAGDETLKIVKVQYRAIE